MNPLESRFGRAAGAIAWRQLHTMITKPAFILPSLLMPIFFFVAFAGGSRRSAKSPTSTTPTTPPSSTCSC